MKESMKIGVGVTQLRIERDGPVRVFHHLTHDGAMSLSEQPPFKSPQDAITAIETCKSSLKTMDGSPPTITFKDSHVIDHPSGAGRGWQYIIFLDYLLTSEDSSVYEPNRGVNFIIVAGYFGGWKEFKEKCKPFSDHFSVNFSKTNNLHAVE